MLAIIDYDMGNLRSVAKAFELLDTKVLITYNQKEISEASHLVLPGVGAFADGMANLKKYGLIDFLADQVLVKKKPILGICLGLQLMAKQSEEFGIHQGLGWLDAQVKAFDLKNYDLKVPHVGWNNIELVGHCPIFLGIKQNSAFYFVHSYHFVPNNLEIVSAKCNYGIDFVAAVWQKNIFATQFHPEKSQFLGLKILKNFLGVKGEKNG
ncbi:MAG: imidazole glycerol phosphate synthase, glutamine amidotransferase subunit [Candidatus Buchananbacteria bacterium RIFCSPHIGHO2_01_FULL_39_14]|uniref:Imidazole glycerol phosphate synthase subunit HisH n=1 Tax=Candidatus Buchananbacteria bacterium RIFCSPHIGHO2_01_FULL_39_14 TaxID=1797532 RepID=A0A1G1XY53_9BACT|nr:MAG: imidazole glycerol phosphate synthase, glutamine amidotransferase subunit [Candidatus Buchananbacteria bacterium RIFCSPHIGHO2_01_FULL_39_14]OGY48657.1 MAG: imidazole glycerol phosphate synthase, glutamine amidotransferase subunit [Candidatus Buchananbacteria bacterium RIFCSPHIGHO2_02_FULL_39_17]